MNISEKMAAFSAIMAEVYGEVYGVADFDFSRTTDLDGTENLLNQMKNFVNSADYLNEMTAILNRALRKIQAEKLKRKGF